MPLLSREAEEAMHAPPAGEVPPKVTPERIRGPRRGRAPQLSPAEVAIVGTLYLATAIVLSFPGVLHLTGEVIGDGGDTPQLLWNITWIQGWLRGEHGLFLR